MSSALTPWAILSFIGNDSSHCTCTEWNSPKKSLLYLLESGCDGPFLFYYFPFILQPQQALDNYRAPLKTFYSHQLEFRAETIFCLVNTLRVYLLWRALRDSLVISMPKRHTVSRFTSVPFGSYFAFKRFLNGWGSLTFIMSLWLLLIVMSAYW